MRLCGITCCALVLLGCGSGAPSDEAMFRVTDAAVDFESDSMKAYTIAVVCGDDVGFSNFLGWRARTTQAAYQRMIESAPTDALRASRTAIADRAARDADTLARQMLDVELQGARLTVSVPISDDVSTYAICRQSVVETVNRLTESKLRLQRVAAAQSTTPR